MAHLNLNFAINYRIISGSGEFFVTFRLRLVYF